VLRAMKSILGKILAGRKDRDMITIVSGLPRSGTSMMMQMLGAGGLPIVTDKTRKPDPDNPRGYLELEKVKQIEKDTSWLGDCEGKAVKMVSALLYHLPKDRRYKVIFMGREMEEILASQRAMLERLGRDGGGVGDEEMGEKFEKHLRDIKAWLSSQGNIDVLYIKYNDVIDDPYRYTRLVNNFLGNRLNADKMPRVVEKSLHRQRR